MESKEFTRIEPIIPPISKSGFMNYRALRVLKNEGFYEYECRCNLVGKKLEPIKTGDIYNGVKYLILDKENRYPALYYVGTINHGEKTVAWSIFQRGSVVVTFSEKDYIIETITYCEDTNIAMFDGIKFDYHEGDKRLGGDIREIFTQCSYGVRDFITCGGGYYAFINEEEKYFEIIPMLCFGFSAEANRNNNDYSMCILSADKGRSHFTPIVMKTVGNEVTLIQYSEDRMHYREAPDVLNYEEDCVDDSCPFMKRIWPTLFRYLNKVDFMETIKTCMNARWLKEKNSHYTINFVNADDDNDLAVVLKVTTHAGVYEDTFLLDFNGNLYKVINRDDLRIDDDHP